MKIETVPTEDKYQVTIWEPRTAIMTETQWGVLRYDEWCGAEVERFRDNGREAWVEEDGYGNVALFCWMEDVKLDCIYD